MGKILHRIIKSKLRKDNLMKYITKVIVKQNEISDDEKSNRLKQFQQAFVTAAVNYYSNKINQQISNSSPLDKK